MKRLFFKHLIGFRTAAGAFCQPRAYFFTCSLALVVATVGTIGLARAADALPSQDQALAGALENHPDIVAAKAKIALAEAELYGKRMEVSRQVLGLYGGLKTLDAQVVAAKAHLAESRADSERQLAEGKLVVATGQREQAEKELRLLIGTAPGTKEVKSSTAAAIPARQAPQGAILDTWKVKGAQPIKISFTEIPLIEVMGFLSDKTGIKFSVQRPALEEAGVAADEPISVSTNEVPVEAALQAFEDTYPHLQFVFRDYGILLTTEEYALQHGYMPVVKRAETSGEGGGGGFF